MSSFPPGPRRRHRLRHRRQQPRLPPRPARLDDIVLLDKGPLPNPGGSTGHASNFIFPVDHSKEMTRSRSRARGSTARWTSTPSGGIEVARTEERMQELRRRMASAKSWGSSRDARHARRDQGARAVHRRVDHARRLLHPGRGRRRLAPRGHDHAREGTQPAPERLRNTEVLGIDVEDGRDPPRRRPRAARSRPRRW